MFKLYQPYAHKHSVDVYMIPSDAKMLEDGSFELRVYWLSKASDTVYNSSPGDFILIAPDHVHDWKPFKKPS